MVLRVEFLWEFTVSIPRSMWGGFALATPGSFLRTNTHWLVYKPALSLISNECFLFEQIYICLNRCTSTHTLFLLLFHFPYKTHARTQSKYIPDKKVSDRSSSSNSSDEDYSEGGGRGGGEEEQTDHDYDDDQGEESDESDEWNGERKSSRLTDKRTKNGEGKSLGDRKSSRLDGQRKNYCVGDEDEDSDKGSPNKRRRA